MMTRYWFNTPKAGNFEIACAELCGMGHYRMRGFLTVHEPADFDKWYKQQIDDRAKELAPPPPPPAAATTPAPTAPATASASGDTSHAASSPAAKDTAGAGK
jgi:cytochrome c oxidase subunit 2